MSHFFRLLLLCLLIPMSHAWADAVAVRLLGAEEGGGVIVAKIEQLLKRQEPDVLLDSGAPLPVGHKKLLVVVGIKAWRQAQEGALTDGPILAVLPPSATAEVASKKNSRVVSTIFLEQPPTRFFNLIQQIPSRNKEPGVIVSPQLLERTPRLEQQSLERGLRLHTEQVDRESSVGSAVERLVQRASVLLALSDATVHTAATVPPLLLISYRAGVPVVAFSESYLRAGAALALYSTPEQIAQQVVENIAAFRQGKALPSIQYARYFSVGVNASVARSLGLALPSQEELESRLRQMKE